MSSLAINMDQRRYERTACDLAADFQTYAGDFPITIKGRVINYSQGGFGFMAEVSMVSIPGGQEIPMRHQFKTRARDAGVLVFNGVRHAVQIRWTQNSRIGMSTTKVEDELFVSETNQYPDQEF